MRRLASRKFVFVLVVTALLSTNAGCSFRAVFGSPFAGGFLGALLGSLIPQTTSVTVERNCFENGVPVDCSQIPAAATAGS